MPATNRCLPAGARPISGLLSELSLRAAGAIIDEAGRAAVRGDRLSRGMTSGVEGCHHCSNLARKWRTVGNRATWTSRTTMFSIRIGPLQAPATLVDEAIFMQSSRKRGWSLGAAVLLSSCPLRVDSDVPPTAEFLSELARRFADPSQGQGTGTNRIPVTLAWAGSTSTTKKCLPMLSKRSGRAPPPPEIRAGIPPFSKA